MAELDLKNYKNRHSLKSKIGRVVWNVVIDGYGMMCS